MEHTLIQARIEMEYIFVQDLWSKLDKIRLKMHLLVLETILHLSAGYMMKTERWYCFMDSINVEQPWNMIQQPIKSISP